ncbi:60S ribosomal protein L31, putative (RPL31) [Plasmodium ovale wallikeri]|uniref:60S ribosomal protein L31, putative n=2 Tax=Plasmodium ovale TaxID=36330 RepID=A0A1C3KF62_PLAOA|nr:60S ribosomal protein L31, putative (RPL31) [Plasmodium ovale wallikeri]SBT37080.1 60S ribosomal protein L31, putative (RPL31) [Plasmodium ovale wallikeri]SBT72273.1 60S ribosomal protein L31, putative [Plasmodium ovale]SCQ16624.1 60S ribosomal protein L31, putative [Plasmodium ovale]
MVKAAKKQKKTLKPVTKVITINLSKLTHGVCYKRKAPRAIKEIRSIAGKLMHTKDVRLDVKLNKFIWSKGIRNPPNRVRVKIERKRNEDEDSKEKMYTIVQHVMVDSFKGLVHECEASE